MEATNQDEIIASMLKYSPAGSEGVDSCAYVSCNYGTYWDGSACRECPENTYLGFDNYYASIDAVLAAYNENKASPKYGDGTDNEELCIPCPSATISIPPSGSVAMTGHTGGEVDSAQCMFSPGR